MVARDFCNNKKCKLYAVNYSFSMIDVQYDKVTLLNMDSKLKEQEEKYQYIIDTIQDGILVLSSIKDEENKIKDFRIEYCNRKGFELGKLPEDCIGKTIFEVLPLDSSSLDAHKRVAETGEPFSYETTFITKEGIEYGWFIISLTKFGDGVVSRYTDITERKKHEQQIELQKNLLNNVFDSSLHGMFICKAIRHAKGAITDLQIQKINKAFTRMTGISEETVLHQTYLTLFPSAKSNGVFDLNCYVINTGEAVRKKVYYEGDHLDAWYDLSICRLDNETILISFSDITDVKKAFVEIEQQKLLLDNILKHSPNGISVYKVLRNDNGNVIDFKCVLANDAVEKLTGISNKARYSKTVYELILEYKDSGKQMEESVLKTLQTNEPSMIEFYHPVSQKWLEFSVAKMDDDHLLNVFKDITQTKESALKTELLVDELKRSNTSLEEFAYAASHDLQEPLRKIDFFCESLKRSLGENVSDDISKRFERMQNAAARMRTLINDLLAYSRVSVKSAAFKRVELNAVAEQVLQDLEATITQTSAKIKVAELPVIKADEGQLRQMFQNIISNALKYRQADVMPEIVITAGSINDDDISFKNLSKEKKKKYHLIEIKDNGIGFPQEYAEKIFHVFQRLHARAEYEGTGVGLAIVQKIVSNHKGYIAALGEPGKGATFRILLPK